MTKLGVTRLIDTSKYLATKSGKELADFIQYLAGFCDAVVRTLSKGIGLQDNVDCKVSTVSFTTGTTQTVNTDGRAPLGMSVVRVVDETYRIDSFGWYIDASGNVKATATFTGSPTAPVSTVLVIWFS